MVTMSDVARRAGVTKQTVSNVLTGRVPVSPETAAKVRSAVAALDYRPNLVARSLATGITRTVGLLVPTAVQSFYAEVIEEVEDALNEHDYHLLLCTTRTDPVRAARQLAGLTSRLVDGLLIAGDIGLAEHLDLLADIRAPIVLCAWESAPSKGLPVVTIDYEQAGYLAGRHLRELGHRRVAVIARTPTHDDRAEGFWRGVHEDEDPRRPVAVTSFSIGATDDPSEAIQAALSTRLGATAIFATHDLVAIQTLMAARLMERPVPQAVSVVGIGDTAEAVHTIPPLTTVALGRSQMARQAVHTLLGAIDGAKPSATTVLTPVLRQRASTARIATEPPRRPVRPR